MDTKVSRMTDYVYTHEVAKYFPNLMVRRMVWIEKLLQKTGMEYGFDVLFDETEDETPTAVFTVQNAINEKNRISMFLSNLKTIEFYGETRIIDLYSVGDIVHRMTSADRGEGIGLVFFAPSIEDYDDDLLGITPVYTLPLAANDVELPVLKWVIPALIHEHQKYLDETEEFEDLYVLEKEPDQEDQSAEAFQSDRMEEPVFSCFKNIDETIRVLGEAKESIRNADEKLQKLGQMLQEMGYPFT